MPTYEYECEKCKSIFEEYQSIVAEPLTKCTMPDCDGAVRRLLSGGAGFLFKGSGFYITDYRSDAYKKSASADTGSAGATSVPSTATAVSATVTPAAASAPSAKPATSSSSSSSSTSTPPSK